MDYTIIQSNAEIKAHARKQLAGVWGEMAFTYLVYFAIYLPYNVVCVLHELHKTWPNIPSYDVAYYTLALVAIVVAGPFALGFTGYFLRRVRGEPIHLSNIFEGFYHILPSFLLTFLSGLFIGLWCLLLIVPGIIKALAYSMAFYIMRDNPAIEPLDAISKSQKMMKGYKWKLFCLQLSFIGWALLCALTLGIGSFWLYPYMSMSMANFYENLKQSQEKAAAAAPPTDPMGVIL